MVEHRRDARASRDLDRLHHRVGVGDGLLRVARQLPLRVLSLAAQVRLVVAAIGRDDLGELEDFLFRAPAPRDVLEARGQPEGTLLHALLHERLHLLDLGGRGLAHEVRPHRHPAHRAVADHRDQVERAARRQELFALPRERPDLRAAVRVDHGGREALRREVGQRAEALQDRGLDVLVERDEAGSDVVPCGIHDARRRRAAQVADGGDPIAANADVGIHVRVAGSVEQAAVPDHDVVSRRLRGHEAGQRQRGRQQELIFH
jgi:hypothetical protein